MVLGLAAVGLLAAMALGGVELLAPIAIVAVVLPVLWVATIMFLDRLSHNAARHRRS